MRQGEKEQSISEDWRNNHQSNLNRLREITEKEKKIQNDLANIKTEFEYNNKLTIEAITFYFKNTELKYDLALLTQLITKIAKGMELTFAFDNLGIIKNENSYTKEALVLEDLEDKTKNFFEILESLGFILKIGVSRGIPSGYINKIHISII